MGLVTLKVLVGLSGRVLEAVLGLTPSRYKEKGSWAGSLLGGEALLGLGDTCPDDWRTAERNERAKKLAFSLWVQANPGVPAPRFEN